MLDFIRNKLVGELVKQFLNTEKGKLKDLIKTLPKERILIRDLKQFKADYI